MIYYRIERDNIVSSIGEDMVVAMIYYRIERSPAGVWVEVYIAVLMIYYRIESDPHGNKLHTRRSPGDDLL